MLDEERSSHCGCGNYHFLETASICLGGTPPGRISEASTCGRYRRSLFVRPISAIIYLGFGLFSMNFSQIPFTWSGAAAGRPSRIRANTLSASAVLNAGTLLRAFVRFLDFMIFL